MTSARRSQIELLQVGPRGDLVVGSDDLRILTITSRGTIVHWFQLRTASRSVGAELCLVLRFLSGTCRPPCRGRVADPRVWVRGLRFRVRGRGRCRAWCWAAGLWGGVPHADWAQA
jgi:hypothetical protein